MVKATVPKRRPALGVTRAALAAARDFTRLKYAQHSDSDLSRIIDEAIDLKKPLIEVADTSGGEVPIIGSRFEKTQVFVVQFEDTPGQLCAVVRDRSVITLLDRDKVDRNLASGRWRQLVNGEVIPMVAEAPVRGAPPALAVVPPIVKPPIAAPAPPPPPAPAPAPEPVASRDPDREEFVVNIPLDLAAHGVRLVEADIALCRAQIADDVARAAAAITGEKLAAARADRARIESEMLAATAAYAASTRDGSPA